MSNHEIITKAIEKWGEERQIDKIIEEMGELTQALLKYRHCEKDNINAHSALQNVIEEHADVLNTLLFLDEIFGVEYSIQVQQVRENKFDRLHHILNNLG